eukprot:CAMPEP_0172453786 /NCGR_PEP_ID=MMETSP1065-20121228/10963_1 /TAXON_ID=265537 /ORGANISM="Amphiprora paludosa, Strain CCMP125" /LENGTH=51 /DNA_ID=CAMNT_0013205999 /DNA_START=15 /DNA_END=167 /DNA_ORIENTATION=+
MGAKRKLEEASSESTGQVFFHSEHNQWKWNNHGLGELYMDEGECQWTQDGG